VNKASWALVNRWKVTAPGQRQLEVPILMYHEIAARQDSSSRLAVSPDSFAAQLAHLREAGFTGLTLTGLASALAGDPAGLPERPVVLTFDDGFADFHDAALPLLSRYGFIATVFVTTGWIADAGRHSVGGRPGRMLCWNQIREAAAAGVEIGAHSHRHLQLDQISLSSLRDELVTSKSLLEDRLGLAVANMAYPYGYSNARVRRVVNEAGYAHACAVGNAIAGPGQDALALPRLTIRRSTRPATFGHIVSGEKESVIFLKDRSLTKGYALVRRARAAARGVSRSA
jgi:peptidoglycan/xylan/chitin deacetylase (PgdA/CDA1 family)